MHTRAARDGPLFALPSPTGLSSTLHDGGFPWWASTPTLRPSVKLFSPTVEWVPLLSPVPPLQYPAVSDVGRGARAGGTIHRQRGRFSHSIVQSLQASICQIDHALVFLLLRHLFLGSSFKRLRI
jgi:hypothetical protein